MVDDARAANWEQEAREVLLQSFDTDNRICRLAEMVLVLIHDRQALLKYISRSQGN